MPPRVRATIINYEPILPALTISKFCKSQKTSRSIFYLIRAHATAESAAGLHVRPARRCGLEVINERVRIRKQLEKDGIDRGPKPSATKRPSKILSPADVPHRS